MKMMMKVVPACAVLLLAACGGGDGEGNIIGSGSGSSNSGGSTTGNGSSGEIVTIARTLDIGTGSGSSFLRGQLTLDTDAISANGQATITVNIVDALDGSLIADEAVSVTFTSSCTTATFSNNPTTTSSGTTGTQYIATGCSGDNTITATLASGASAIGSIFVASADLGSLSYVSATPDIIALANLSGSTIPTTSAVQFELLDTASNPIAGEEITFSLTGTTGGVSLASLTATTNAQGIVTAYANSGTVKATFRVKAAVTATPEVSTSSNPIVVSTGIAIQKSLSLAVSQNNPDSWLLLGTEVAVTASVSDFYQNPVPDDTSILFFTGAGTIYPTSCLTKDGICTVTWRSSNPKATDGRFSIMATLKGEETSYTDTNSNGLFDEVEGFEALGEAYVDDNWNDDHDAGEHYIDSTKTAGTLNGIYDDENTPAVPTYRGIRCSSAAKAAGHCNQDIGLADIFVNIPLVMSSGGEAEISLAGTSYVGGPTITIAHGGSETFVLTAQDVNGNALPSGTTVSVTFTKDADDAGATADKIVGPLASAPLKFTSTDLILRSGSFTIVGNGTASAFGELKITVSVPDRDAVVSTYTVIEL